MLDPANHPAVKPAQFRADTMIAESRHRQWRIRFGKAYRSLDAHRCKQIQKPSQSCMAIHFVKPELEESHDPRVKKTLQGLSERGGNERRVGD
jgi:hypothetical protein